MVRVTCGLQCSMASQLLDTAFMMPSLQSHRCPAKNCLTSSSQVSKPREKTIEWARWQISNPQTNTVEMVQGHMSTNQESFRVTFRQSESGFISPHHFIIRKVLCSSSDSSSDTCSTSLYHRVLSRKTLGLLDLHWLWWDEPLTQFGFSICPITFWQIQEITIFQFQWLKQKSPLPLI